MFPFKFLLDKTTNSNSDLQSFALVFGLTIGNYQENSKAIKDSIKKALLEWLDLAENETRKENLAGDIDINDTEILLFDEHFLTLLAKQGIYDLDITILEADSDWNHDDNILD